MSAGGLSYSGLTTQAKVTLPSVESWGTNMNILRNPVTSIQTRRIDKVGQTQNILLEQDDSGDRIAECIQVYARGVNPMVSVSYDNASNNSGALKANIPGIGQASLPYKVENVRPPVGRQEDLLPLSRLNRVWNHAVTNPEFPFYKSARECNTINKSLIKEQNMIRGDIPQHAINNMMPTITEDAIRLLPTHSVIEETLPVTVQAQKSQSDRHQPLLPEQITDQHPQKCISEQTHTIPYMTGKYSESFEKDERPHEVDVSKTSKNIERNKNIYEAFTFLGSEAHKKYSDVQGWQDLKKTVKQNLTLMNARAPKSDSGRGESLIADRHRQVDHTQNRSVRAQSQLIENVLAPLTGSHGEEKTNQGEIQHGREAMFHSSLLQEDPLRVQPLVTKTGEQTREFDWSLPSEQVTPNKKPLLEGHVPATVQAPYTQNKNTSTKKTLLLPTRPTVTDVLVNPSDAHHFTSPHFLTDNDYSQSQALNAKRILVSGDAGHQMEKRVDTSSRENMVLTPKLHADSHTSRTFLAKGHMYDSIHEGDIQQSRNLPVHEQYTNHQGTEQDFKDTKVLERQRRVLLSTEDIDSHRQYTGLSQPSGEHFSRNVQHKMHRVLDARPTQSFVDNRGGMRDLNRTHFNTENQNQQPLSHVPIREGRNDWSSLKHQASANMQERHTFL
jgi:hypothetical protein